MNFSTFGLRVFNRERGIRVPANALVDNRIPWQFSSPSSLGSQRVAGYHVMQAARRAASHAWERGPLALSRNFTWRCCRQAAKLEAQP